MGVDGISLPMTLLTAIIGFSAVYASWNIEKRPKEFFVLLLMAIAGCLSNGLDQYLVFRNPNNMDTIRVLDLWVYDLGINGGSIPLSTVIGMAKSIVSVALLFGANSVSKALRGESIV